MESPCAAVLTSAVAPLTLMVTVALPLLIPWAVRLLVIAVLTVVLVPPGRTPARQPTSEVAAKEFVAAIPRPNSMSGMMTEKRKIGATMANSTAAAPRRARRRNAVALMRRPVGILVRVIRLS